MNKVLEDIETLSESQKQAVNCGDGPTLILAGPGVGKTKVLTLRLAKILQESSEQKFRGLALTFTTKAADEMRYRVERLVPNVSHRMFIGTFHSFCAKVLRQHGSHIGLKPDFVIYDNFDDRNEVFKEALVKQNFDPTNDLQNCRSWLRTIDQLRRMAVQPENAFKFFNDSDFGNLITKLYKIYEQALVDSNALDFDGLILNASQLMRDVPIVASSYQTVYKYWFIDEFQDTTASQYHFVKIMAGDHFNNIFVVADDDQIIFQWAGARFEQMRKFRDEFSPNVMQLVENRRCPASIVRAANSLIAHNTVRITSKRSLVSLIPNGADVVRYNAFANETQEASSVAGEIQLLLDRTNESIAVLGRTKAVLEPILLQLRDRNVRSKIAIRRDNFVSPHFNWLTNCLELANQPSNQRTFRKLTVFGNLVSGTNLDPEIIIAEPISTCISYLEHWAKVMARSGNTKANKLASLATELVRSRSSWRPIVERAIETLIGFAGVPDNRIDDIVEDREAWRSISANILSSSYSSIELPEFLHEMNIRSKDPPANPLEVRLFTIHSAKGLEFDHVRMIGMAEEILPSWYSLKQGAELQLLEEERRACFVGMTRAKKSLTFSYPQSYNGFPKQPSRFLREMGLI